MKKKYEEIIEYVKNDKAVLLRMLFTALAAAALAYSVLRVLRGQAEARIYSGRPVWEGFSGMDL